MKKSIKVFTFIFVFLFAICTSSFNFSNAKYIKELDIALRYQVTFKPMTGNYISHYEITSSNYEYLYYIYTFKRSGNMQTNDSYDAYLIKPKAGCSIVSINTNNASISNDKTIVKFEDIGDESIKVQLKCKVSDIIYQNTQDNDVNLRVGLQVYEYFNDDGYKFKYLDGINQINNYYQNHHNFESTDTLSEDKKGFTMTSSRKNKAGGLRTWLTEFSSYYEVISYDEIKNYIDFNYSDINAENISKLDEVEGITAEIIGDTYKFTIDNNFISLVKTHKYHDIKRYYFYDESDANNLLLYYLNKYELYSQQQIQVISDYLTDDIITLAKNYNIGLKYSDEEKYLTGVENLYNFITRTIPTYNYDISKPAIRKVIALYNSLKVTSLYETDLLDMLVKLDENGNLVYYNDRLFEILSITSGNFDRYMYFKGSSDSILVHIYSNETTIDSQNKQQVCIDISYILSSPIDMNYVNFDVALIKSDLDYISNSILGESLILLDNEQNIINNYETLENGEYHLNIGNIIVLDGNIKLNLSI